ncbi:MAG: HAD family phosphatase [Acidobacteria bacterium]|nr:HAD family phosphatase [Acidobacteriota bacterium]
MSRNRPYEAAASSHEQRHRFRALACDYDGTLAVDGRVDATALAALRALKQTGYQLVLVTGRELGDLQHVFPDLPVFELAVVENGAVLFTPSSGSLRLLAAAPLPDFVEELRRRRVTPLSTGHVIVATERPQEPRVRDAIRDLDLPLEVIFNKEALMVLPAGVDKTTGLTAALADLDAALDQTVGIGDAENDVTFLDRCGLSAAVANAVDSLKERVHLVTEGGAGAGVVELIDRLLAPDEPG